MTSKDIDQFSWPIIGNKKIISFLQKSISTDSYSHAYLFSGSHQIGKRTTALHLTASLLCKSESKAIPCFTCSSCKKVFENNHQSVLNISRQFDDKTKKLKKNISVEQIRNLQSSLSLKSFDDNPTIALINDAEHLSIEAANSLLKTLEEPKGKVVIILITNNYLSLPETIISRCQVLRFSVVDNNSIAAHLKSLGVDIKKARNLAALSGGLPGKAIDFLQNKEFYEDYQSQVKQFLEILTANSVDRLLTIGKIKNQASNEDWLAVLQVWQVVLRDIILIKLQNNNLIRHAVFFNGISNYIENHSVSYFLKALNAIKDSRKYLMSSVNPRLALEQIIITL